MNKKATPGSVSHWLAKSDAQDVSDGAQLLWMRFGVRLVRLARRQLRQAKDPAYEAEDLALSTLGAYLLDSLNHGSFRPANRHQLWSLLSTISLNKSRNFRKSLARTKRHPEVAKAENLQSRMHLLQDRSTNSPELVAILADQCEFLLRVLDRHDPTGELKTIGLMRLDGASQSKIAKALGCTRFTVAARINLIQSIWQHHLSLQSS